MIDVLVSLGTGTGFYVLFEIDQMSGRAGTAVDWFVYRDVKVALANEGVAVFIEVGIDDSFLFRLTSDALTEIERAAIRQSEDRFWLDIKGHELIFSSSEAVPDRNHDATAHVEEYGIRIPVEPGRYRVVVHRLIGPHTSEVDQLLDRSVQRIPAYVIEFRSLAAREVPPFLDTLPSLSILLDQEDPMADSGSIDPHYCRVCGLYYNKPPRGEDGRTPSHDICLCCGVEFGYEDFTLKFLHSYRQQWLDGGATWFYPEFKPEGWDLDAQLQQIPTPFR